MGPFFLRNGKSGAGSTVATKRKAQQGVVKKKKLVKKPAKFEVSKAKTGKKFKSNSKPIGDNAADDDDDEILSSDIEDDDEIVPSNKRVKGDPNLGSEDDEAETAQEKKVRLAKKYLAELEQQEAKGRRDGSSDDEDEESGTHRSNLISSRLKDAVLEKAGKLHRKVAEGYRVKEDGLVVLKNGHRKPITCCVVSNDGRHVFTGSKDCNVIKWDAQSGKRLRTIFGDHRKSKEAETFKGHTSTVTSLALSTDFKFLASGCENRVIHIWNPNTLEHVHTFRGHRGGITGLAFRKSFHQLFSSSADRMVKVWNLDEMAYVESLFGHHDTITSIDSFVRERALTSGGRDGSIRLWKIPEESHLIFLTGGETTIDVVRLIDENHFLSASDDGTVSMWALFKKKPLFTVKATHGPDCWITAMTSLRNTDLFATGSYNGKIIFWRIVGDFSKFEKIFEYDVTGFVNCLEFTGDGLHLVAAVSQEHRLGRWWRIKEARNVVHVIPLESTLAT